MPTVIRNSEGEFIGFQDEPEYYTNNLDLFDEYAANQYEGDE